MKRFVFIGVLLLLGMSSDLPMALTRGQVAAILADLELAKALVETYTEDEDLRLELLQMNKKLIYESHGVDEAYFQSSFQAHFEQLDALRKLYSEVIDHLEILEANEK